MYFNLLQVFVGGQKEGRAQQPRQKPQQKPRQLPQQQPRRQAADKNVEGPSAPNDPTLVLRESPPTAFNKAKSIRGVTRIATRVLVDPTSCTTRVEQNVLIPTESEWAGNSGGRSRQDRRIDNGYGNSDRVGLPDDKEKKDADGAEANGAAPLRAYLLQRVIRRATFGPVWSGVVLRARPNNNGSSPGSEPEAEWEVTDERCAIKEMEWRLIRQYGGRYADNPINEVEALQYLMEQQFHVQLERQAGAQSKSSRPVLLTMETLSDGRNLYTVTPFCSGGDLFDRLEGAKNFNEREARYWMRQILHGIEYLQQMGICHRDLSPENILVRDGRGIVIDFGMCLRVPFEGNTQRRYRMPPQGTCGKWHYMSPEVRSNVDPFDGFAVDLWAAGVMLFIMLTGFPPWDQACDTDRRYRIMSEGGMARVLQYWGLNLSDSIMDLLQKMLYKDPFQRLTLSEVWQHPWIVAGEGDEGATFDDASNEGLDVIVS